MANMSDLPAAVDKSINAFVDSAKTAFGADLSAIVIYGSAAEGRLRATSDVNMLLVLKRFEQAGADQMREPLRLARATIELNAMFLLEDEMPMAMEAFAVKFADIVARHRVLFGADPFAKLDPSREALARRLKQVLLNLQLRLRERYVLLSLREEQLARVVADAAGPLRSSAASLRQLEGAPPLPPKEALEAAVRDMNDAALTQALRDVSAAREDQPLAPGTAGTTMLALLTLTKGLRERVARVDQPR